MGMSIGSMSNHTSCTMIYDFAGIELALIRDGRKPRTIQKILWNLKHVLSLVPELTKEHVEPLLLKLSKDHKATYINTLIDSLRSASRYDPRIYVPQYFKEKEFVKATMSDEEIEAFLNLPPETHIINYPGRAPIMKTWGKGYHTWTLFFSLMAYTGMRCGEVAGLTVEAIDFGRGVFILEDTKTNEPRFVPIPPNLTEKLTLYISKCDNYLFPSLRDGKKDGPVVDNVDWHYNFHKRIKRMGLKRKNLTPYSLRHSFITRMLEEDVNIFKVQKIVGHHRIETTNHYTHLTTKDMIQALSKHPIIRRATDTTTIIKAIGEYVRNLHLENDQRFSVNVNESNDAIEFRVCLK